MTGLKYRWGSAGCGVIAEQLAAAIASLGGELYGVSNRTHSKAVDFAERHGVKRVYASYEEMIDDSAVEVVYISTPHNTHIGLIRRALRAKKHVLCEKAITLNSDELNEAVKLARENDVVLAEAQTIYHMPLYPKLKKMMNSGKFGKLRLIQLNFGSYKEYDMKNRFYNPNLAGGAMLDIGVYALSLARFFLSSSPSEVQSIVNFAPSGVDEMAGLLLKNTESELTSLTLSLHTKQPKRATIAFDECYVEIFEYPRADKAVITWTADGMREEIAAGATARALEYEVLDMEQAIDGDASLMHLGYTVDVMDIMTKVRCSWGLKYSEEM